MAKYEDLYKALKNQIITLSSGDSYPSMRTIMKDYGVSQATTSKATEMLLNEGFLQKSLGKGMTITEEVNKYKKGAAPVIGLALPHWQSDWNSAIEHCFYELEAELGYQLEVIHYDWRSKIITKLPQIKIDGLVVVPSASLITADEINILDGFGIPYTLFARHLSGMAVNCVSADNRHSGALVANHLIELGHTSIAIVITQPRMETLEQRIEGFRSMCELRNVNYVEVDCNLSDGDYCPEKVYEKFSELVRSGKMNFTGAMSMCLDSCVGIYRAIYENGLRIPEDLCLVGVGDQRLFDYLYPPLSRLSTCIEEMVTAAANIIIPKINGIDCDAIVQTQVKPYIVMRGSTCKCRKQMEKPLKNFATVE